MFVRGLKRGGVLLVHCEVLEESVKVGMMFTQEPARGRTVKVFEAEGQDPEGYWVEIPADVTVLQLGAELKRVPDPMVNQ